IHVLGERPGAVDQDGTVDAVDVERGRPRIADQAADRDGAADRADPAADRPVIGAAVGSVRMGTLGPNTRPGGLSLALLPPGSRKAVDIWRGTRHRLE